MWKTQFFLQPIVLLFFYSGGRRARSAQIIKNDKYISKLVSLHDSPGSRVSAARITFRRFRERNFYSNAVIKLVKSDITVQRPRRNHRKPEKHCSLQTCSLQRFITAVIRKISRSALWFWVVRDRIEIKCSTSSITQADGRDPHECANTPELQMVGMRATRDTR